MFSVLKTQPIEYISIYDAAIDHDAFTTEKIRAYVQSRDRSLLPLRPDAVPVVWTLAPLDEYALQYALDATPKNADGTRMPTMLNYHLAQVGIAGVTGTDPDAPEFDTHKIGLLTKVVDDFVRAIPPLVVGELANVIYDLSTVDAATKKKSKSHSGAAKSQSGSTAKDAPSGEK